MRGVAHSAGLTLLTAVFAAACARRAPVLTELGGRPLATVGPCVAAGAAWQAPPGTAAVPLDSVRAVPPLGQPRYPAALRRAGQGGKVVVSFVIDTAGRVDPRSARVTSSPDPALSAAVCDFLPRARYARRDGGALGAPARVSTWFQFTAGQ